MSDLNSYRVIRPIGSGTFGKVKREHRSTGQQVALKVLNKEHIKQRRVYSKIRTEVKILQCLHHPHVVSLFDVINTPKNLILVTEYIPGGELYGLIERRGRLSEEEANFIFQQLISALEYCHFHSIVHRDIKPENILLDSDGDIKLADFGLGNLLKDGEFLRTSCGSPNYAPPEIIHGKQYAGPEIDIWSAGVVLYALVAGSLPFDESNISTLYSKIKNAKFECPFHFSTNLRDLIYRMLWIDPIERITIPQIRRHPWFNRTSSMFLRPQLGLKCEEEVNESVLQQVLTLREFSNLITPMDEIRRNILNNSIAPVTVAYRILLNCKINKIKRDGYSMYPQSPLFAIQMDESTRSDSVVPEVSETDIPPHNWVYGIRSQLHPSKLINQILLVLKHWNFEWNFVDNYKLIARTLDLQYQFMLGIFEYRNTSVFDFRVIQGNHMVFFEVMGAIYSSLHSITHIK